jgi:hypothetical protein
MWYGRGWRGMEGESMGPEIMRIWIRNGIVIDMLVVLQ